MDSTPAQHTIPPTLPHTHTIIFLHGRGSSATTFASELFESQDGHGGFFTSIFPAVKWICPCAPTSWAASEQESIPQWFDIASVQRPWEEAEMQHEGLEESAKSVAQVIEREAGEVGGIRVGGFVGLCGWVPVEDFEDEANTGHDVKEMPVLLQHCRDDEVVPVGNGEALAIRLRKMERQVEWECFEEGGHWLNEPAGMDGIVRFIEKTLGNGEQASAKSK
ncbi:Alpha/Beta hydrolase protein [Phaeosphaeria sp. MPI-PUGE-AT-0046c]|nr:Alpha/Beta hydrolase protein [Phaeosphaeria sp. MPI-PUGE-AT-0046c]